MKNFINQMLNDTKGNVSSKRVITFVAFVLMALGFIVNVFMEIPIKEFIWDGMLYLVTAGLGFSTLEHFSKK
jgi:hypothetical protein